MKLPDLVLIHGGEHAADCWDLTVAELHRQAPELRIVAIDLPGRRSRPANRATVTIADWVNSAVADIEQAGCGDVVVAGHSMAGLTVPGVIAKLGASRVREMVLMAAFIPPDGATLVDTLSGPMAPFARLRPRLGEQFKVPLAVKSFAFCNGMTREQRKFTMSRIYPESPNVIAEHVDRSGMPENVPRTWILTLRDRVLSQRQQHKCIKALGGVDTVIPIDACHEVMISHPRRLATILVERCHRRAVAHQ